MKKIIIPLLLSIISFLLCIPLFTSLTSNLHPIVLLVLFVCIFVVTITMFLAFTGQRLIISKSFFYGFFLTYSISLFILLFWRPNDQIYESINLMPFETIIFYLSGTVHWIIAFYNLAANIGLFVPFGILLRFKTSNRMTLCLLPFLLISLIEVGQYITKRGSMDIDDLILNVVGFYIGYLFFPLFRRVYSIGKG
ncbi:VanZ family protein [Sutcliffiella rhizosphaerae]|uniref:VanZ-like domain-containing protein n=1 Tax=Sutcliffiella rhizosphaerae TaxID=2880967 RepID=A0ABM8YJD7_9BACI|nr:VanZ family protein [Sutcliffiella rhizosphaerae]CAG9620049.1 hypothetical protein BACCIP111883_00817 [Sutcliffiella rhizosphaerae]